MTALLALLLAGAPAPNLYDLDVTLVDQVGKTIKLDTFRGHPVVISMFYGTCTSACPLLVAKVQSLEAKLSPSTRAAVRVLLVSFDPDRDTPPQLRKLAASFGVDDRWRLAQTHSESVRDLAAALGIRYRFLPGGALSHSSVLTVLDPQGAVVTRVEGLDAPSEALRLRLEALASAPR